jgi:hypothetical protein
VKLEAIVPQERSEELVQGRSESPLIESRKGYHVPTRWSGGRRVLRQPTSLELRH